jgi:hypothetical protein
MDHSTKVWSQVAKWFQRRIFLVIAQCTDGRPTQSDDTGSPEPFGSGELKKKGCFVVHFFLKIVLVSSYFINEVNV